MATTYDYRANVIEDIKNYIEENNITIYTDTQEEQYQELYDELFISDSVTGNASGSYTFNTYQAEENLCYNLDLLGEALDDFGCEASHILKRGAEACDVTIRCYLLGECLQEVLEEIAIEREEEELEEEEENKEFIFVWEDAKCNQLQCKKYNFNSMAEAKAHRDKLLAECNINDCVRIEIY